MSGIIEADDEIQPVKARPAISASGSSADAEHGGISGILRQSAHPLALAFLYLFRTAAIVVYVLCGLFTDNYVLSIVLVVVLLSLDFWNTRNISGRILVGLRYFNEVNDDGESSWVFESRDPACPRNAVDVKMFWLALYAYPLGWLVLLCVSVLKFNISFLPIVILALVFNVSNLLGFTYADRDAQRVLSQSSSNILGFGTAMGGQVIGRVLSSGLGKVLR